MSRTHFPFSFFCKYITYVSMQGDVQEPTESVRKDITNSHVTNSFSLLFFSSNMYMYIYAGGRARANREYSWGYHQPSCHELIFPSFFFYIRICIFMQGDVQELTESLREDITNPKVKKSFVGKFNKVFCFAFVFKHAAAHWNTLQHTTAHCSTLQHTASHCNTLQHTATHCNTLHIHISQNSYCMSKGKVYM